ncbi:hypothetical protein Plhal703r1_c39g0137161 [Plasmopara halstedii]
MVVSPYMLRHHHFPIVRTTSTMLQSHAHFRWATGRAHYSRTTLSCTTIAIFPSVRTLKRFGIPLITFWD